MANIMADETYKIYKKKSIEDLARLAAGSSATGSNIEIAKLVYSERMLERQHKYAKEQIELQHIKNTEILDKQVFWVKLSAILNAIVIMLAVLWGWWLSEINPVQNIKQDTPKTVQRQNETSTSAFPTK